MNPGHSHSPAVVDVSVPGRAASLGTAANPARQPPGPDMVWIPGGTFLMGSDDHYPEEAPAHRVTISGFWMDRHTVTNRDFARFVAETGHVTVAEQAPDPADYPGAKPELLVPASTVFVQPARRVDLGDPYNWWTYVPGADWRHPQGPGSSVEGLAEHPVVQLAWADVEAYAAWAGKSLPTEAEWEFAARGGLDGATYAWGEEFTPSGRWMANTWQGEFPIQNTGQDGYAGTAPVGSFPANGYGLADMIGNVWEWTSDWYQAHAETSHACCAVSDPRGGTQNRSSDTNDPVRIPRRVMKGGSHLCSPNYCQRYRPAARMPQAVDTATSHLGFRCIIHILRPLKGTEMALSDALINLGHQAKELEDSAAGARAENEAKLRARTDELRTSIAEAKSDMDKKADEKSAEISGRWKQMQESVADGFESLRENVEARRADRAVARAERSAENAEFDAEAAVTFAVFALQQAEYYVLAAAVARADANDAEGSRERQ